MFVVWLAVTKTQIKLILKFICKKNAKLNGTVTVLLQGDFMDKGVNYFMRQAADETK